MIVPPASDPSTILTNGLVLPHSYKSTLQKRFSVHQFSEPARYILRQRFGAKIALHAPEVLALHILDFLSGRQGYVRRSGRSFRTVEVYEKMLPSFTKTIALGKPLLFSAICLSPNFTNQNLCGKSPYPHMASYIALENLHKIADTIQEIYPPGAQFALGFEGYVFQSIYFHNSQVLRSTKGVFEELNEIVHGHLRPEGSANPVRVMDVRDMIEEAFGSLEHFESLAAEHAKTLLPDAVSDWQKWYETAVPTSYFPSENARQKFIQEKSYWRAAVRSFHYIGGEYGKGFVGFTEDAIPFSPAGRHSDMLALQLVPENPYLPHQRAITFEPQKKRWRMAAYRDIAEAPTRYTPRFVRNYNYPFYYEKV